MQRQHLCHWSPALQRPMQALVFGQGGAPVLVFPTSRGRFFQWEDFGMIAALQQPLREGKLQLFCLDSIDQETWYDFERPISQVLALHERYEGYILEEFLPRLRRHNPVPFLTATGTSFGAFQAVNLAARHPQAFQRVVALSGDFDVSKNLDDCYAPPAYFFNPMAYLARVQPGSYLERLRNLEFRLAVGSQDFCLGPTQALTQLLQHLNIPHRLDLWGGEWSHDWPTWRAMAPVYL